MITHFSTRLIYWLRHKKASERKSLFDTTRKNTEYLNNYVDNTIEYGKEYVLTPAIKSARTRYKNEFNKSFFKMLEFNGFSNDIWTFNKTPYDYLDESIEKCEKDLYGHLLDKLVKTLLISNIDESNRKQLTEAFHIWMSERLKKDEEYAALREFTHQIADYKNYSEFKKDFESVDDVVKDSINSALAKAYYPIDLSKFPGPPPEVKIYYEDGTYIGPVLHKFQFDWFRLQACTLNIILLFTVPCITPQGEQLNVPGRMLPSGQVEIQYADAYPYYNADALSNALTSYLNIPLSLNTINTED